MWLRKGDCDDCAAKNRTKKPPFPVFRIVLYLKKYYLTISYLLVGICQNGVSHALNKWRIEIKR